MDSLIHFSDDLGIVTSLEMTILFLSSGLMPLAWRNDTGQIGVSQSLLNHLDHMLLGIVEHAIMVYGLTPSTVD